MCLNPKWIYKKGFYKSDNYRGYKGQFYELGTFSKCGHCEQCINEKCNNWLVRNYYEEKSHQEKSFITLTYKDNPYIIVKKDLQDFIKRLRIYLDRYENGRKIRIYACQEYGERYNRPHGHVIIYGWEDKKAKYLEINQKGNIVYQSNIIQKIWGLGRTSYQKFDENEVPYISLYNTAKETYKKCMLVNREKIKKLEKYAKTTYYKFNDNARKNLLKELKEIKKEFEKSKSKYLAIKEYNTWSIALGWENFYKEFLKNSENYAFIEYIGESEFPTPSPWVKKLANMGYYSAIKEMYRREQEIIQSKNEEEEIQKNKDLINLKKKDDIKKHIEKTQKDGGYIM